MIPIEQHEVEGLPIYVVRLDQTAKPPLPPHYKMGALRELIKAKAKDGVTLIGAFASHGSNWVLGLPILCNEFQVQAVICYATNPRAPKLPDWLKEAREYGAHVEPLKPNMTAINSRQAQTYVESQEGYFIPFGLNAPEVIHWLTNTTDFDAIPADATLLMCAGSGITAAGLLLSLDRRKQTIANLFIVSTGRPLGALEKTISQHANAFLRQQAVSQFCELYDGYSYSQIPKVESPWPTHSYYERKAYDWLTQNVERLAQMQPLYFLNVGIE